MMEIPRDYWPDWVKALTASLVSVAGAAAVFLTKYKGTSDKEKRNEATAIEVKRLATLVAIHEGILAEHTGLHKSYVRMHDSIESTRDCVNRIAGKVGVEGTN